MTSLRYWWLSAASLAILASVSACTGGTAVAPATANGAAAVAPKFQAPVEAKRQKRGTANIMIRVPRKKKHGRRMSPEYISASTQSMVIADAGQTNQVFDLTSTSPGCAVSKGTGYLTCSETAFFPSGAQTLTITLYDQPGGQGKQLSTATTSVNIVTGGVTNIPITLDGIVATATVLLSGVASDSIPEGTATTIPVSVEAYDADKNLIVAPGSYSSSITLTDSNTSGATSLATTNVTSPGESIGLSYNGAALSSATITPSVNGTSQPSGAATLTLIATPTPSPTPSPTPTPPPSGGTLLYVNANGYAGGSEDILVYPAASTAPASIGSITSGATAPMGRAVDAGGNLWLTSTAGGGSVVEYVKGQSAFAATPTTVLTNLGSLPEALAFDAQGNLYVATESSVNEYPNKGGSINSTPSRQVNTGVLFQPGDTNPNENGAGMAVDAHGNIWIAPGGGLSGSYPYLDEIPVGATSLTQVNYNGLSTPWDVAVGPDGTTLFVADAANNAIEEFPSGSSTASVKIPITSPQAVSFDASGNLYAVWYTTEGCFGMFAAGATTASWSVCNSTLDNILNIAVTRSGSASTNNRHISHTPRRRLLSIPTSKGAQSL